MSACKKLENDYNNYSLYVHGWWLIWLAQQRQAGKLKQGNTLTILILIIVINKRVKLGGLGGSQCYYTGEVDETGKTCGNGVIVNVNNPNVKTEGTFLNGARHGISK